MVQGDDTRYFHVRLTVPRRDGWRQWGAVRGEFGRELAGQESTTVIGPRVDSEVRRGPRLRPGRHRDDCCGA